MKQETGKKSKLWLWIVLAVVALLAVAGVVVGMMFFNQGEAPATEPVEEKIYSEVYWNLDRVKFTQDSETGLSTREKEADGLYHFRFASQGQLMELATADKQLVNFIDTMDACGLQLDADGLIIDVLDVKTIAVETAKSFYVKSIKGTTITVNSSIAMNGMDITFEKTDSTHVMDVRPNSETLGQTIELDVMDVVSVYGSEDVPAKSVYITDRPESSPLYLRVDRLYSSAEASTTRVPDENGVYTIPFAINGKIEQLKCKDKAVVTGIDSGTDAKQLMGLTFDEEGYITGTILAATAARGKLACQVYHVTAINGNAIEATRLMSGSEQGKVVNFNLTEETQIVMGETDCGHFMGEKVESLQMNDRIIAWSDMENNAVYVLIVRRQVSGDNIAMYYNFKKKYDSGLKETSRVPDVNGYYVFELASNGKVVTVKTKDKAIATQMDADSFQFFGLRVDKGIVKQYYSKDCLTGGYGIGGTTRYVTQVMATIVQLSGSGTFDSFTNYILTPDTEIYDLTQNPGSKIGAKTQLQLGDRVIAARDVLNNITHIYVLNRYYSGCKMYYNESRKYNSTTLETTRTPDAEGYYVYTMYCEGKKVEVKTKDKAIANVIDAQNAPIVAMKVSNDGIVKIAYPAICGQMYGRKVFNNNYVNELTADKTLSCYYFSGGERFEASSPFKLADNCKIYNVSTNYKNYRGEKATLKPGDKIQAIQDYSTGQLTHIWIMSRAINSPLYMHTNRIAPTNGFTNRNADADGYYSVDLFVDGKIKTFRTKDAELMGRVDSYGSETFFAMEVKGDIIQRVDGSTASTRGINNKVSYMDITKISGKTITVERKKPGQSTTGATLEFTYTSKTQIYDVSYYSGDARFKPAKLKKGDRISVYTNNQGEITYIFVMYPSMHVKGYESKCPHCNKVVWWEPFTGSFINTAGDQIVHYYQPADFERGQGTLGVNVNTNKTVAPFTAVFDMNGKTYTATSGRNFLAYFDLILIDTVGGGVLEANGYQGGGGGNFFVMGGSVTVNDGITIRQNNSPDAIASTGGNFNVSSLSITDEDGKVVKTNIGKVILNDAKLEGWDCINGGNINLNSNTELIIKKATITGGDILVNEGAKVKLNGSNIKIGGEGIILKEGVKIAESKLSGNSKVTVQANGIFTEKLSDAKGQKAFYEPEFKFYPIEIKDSALWTDRDPSKPDYVKEPEIPALPETMSIDNTALSLDANKQAKCPVCDKVVTWTAITDMDQYHVLVDGMHYYLPADTTYEKADLPFIQVKKGATACLHLNDHNLTATNAQAAQVFGTLSIMGNGTVSGNGFANQELLSDLRPDLHGATIEANGTAAVINLYGGTYVKSAENDARKAMITKNGETYEASCANNMVEIHGNGGTINMFEGVVLDARGTKKPAMQSYWGMFNLYGGEIYGGSTNAVSAGNWTTNKSGGFSMYGGTVHGSVYGGGVSGGPGYLNIYGGVVEGNLSFNANTKFVLAGNPVLTKVVQPTNKNGDYSGLIILGKLTEGAIIPIHGSEAISFQTENAADYLKYFQSLTGTEIVHQNFAVSFYYVPDPELPEVPEVMPAVTDDLQFIGESNWALCALCKEYVKWTPIKQSSHGTNSLGTAGKGSHYFLAEDVTYTGTTTFVEAPGTDKTYTACFHLNGHNITTANSNFAHGSWGTFNVLGNGVVTGNGKSGAAVTINTSADKGGGMFLYSGTFTKVAGNEAGVVQVNSNGGRIWVGPDAVIQTAKGKLAAKVAGGNLISGYLNIEGTVKGGYVQSDKLTVKDGLNCMVVMELTNATLEGGAKIAKDTILGLFGETKINGLDLTSGAKIIVSELSGAANVTVKADGQFTDGIEDAKGQAAFYAPIVGYYPVEVKNDELWTSDDPAVEEEVEIVFPEIPAKPAQPAVMSVDNTALTLDAENKAKCPVCNEVVTWTAITSMGANRVDLVGGGHYYLAEDVVYTGEDTAIGLSYNAEYKGTTTCLHLNDHNITAEQGIAIFNGMTMNIVGNGIVSGNRSTNNRAATLEINSSVALLNVYGGTYIRPATSANPVVGMNGAGGVLNIFEGVEIGNTDFTGKGDVVRNFNGTINVWGGTIWGGADGYCLRASSAKSGSGNVYGTINIMGGKLQAKSGGSVAAISGCTMNIFGGDMGGTATVNTGAKVSISGNPEMNRLQVNKDATIILGELTEGASVTVRAYGVFTQPCEFAEANVENGYVVPFSGWKSITIVNSALFTEEGADEGGSTPTTPTQPTEPSVPETTAPAPTEPEATEPVIPELTQVDNKALELDLNNQALCPVCNEVVTWTELTDVSAVQTLVGGTHYVLTSDLTFEAEEFSYLEVKDAKAVCFHLNDHNITATNAMVFSVTGKLNLMGNGIVTGNGVSTNIDAKMGKHRGGTLEVNKKDAVLNVYGGTYTKAADNNTHVIAGVYGAGGTMNIFEGATFDAKAFSQNGVRAFTGVVNVYGGELIGGKGSCLAASNWTDAAGGSGTVNVFGGKLSAGSGASITAGGTKNAFANVSIYGGTINGNYTVSDPETNVYIAGNPVMSKITVNEGNKITLGELTEGASINVKANGVFTFALENPASFLTYVKAAETGKEIVVADDALSCVTATVTPEPTEPEASEPEATEPTEPEIVVDNSNLVFEEGTNKAKCPLCGEVVEWIAITQEGIGATGVTVTKANEHYYLAEDITFTAYKTTGSDGKETTVNSFITGPSGQKQLCIHLNGHNFTGVDARFLFGYSSKSAIMGNGIVASGLNVAAQGGIAWNTNNKNDISIDLYGGVYTVAPGVDMGSPIAIQANGGVINIHKDVTVIGTTTAPAIYVGVSGMRNSELYIDGATVYGYIATNTPKVQETAYTATVVLTDAIVDGVKLAKGVSFTVEGNTKIGKLEVAAEALITVGELGSAAKIDVVGNGIITEANDKIASYFGNFVSTHGCAVSVEGNAIKVVNNAKKLDNSALSFAEGSNVAKCPYCQKDVEWTAITEITEPIELAVEGHAYLANDIVWEGDKCPINYSWTSNENSRKISCLHLNGHNLTATKIHAIFAGSYLNVMGEGTVSGNNANSGYGATVVMNSTAARLNLFGGTYVKAAENTKTPIVGARMSGGILNIYEGAVIDGTGLTSEGAGCIQLEGTAKTETAAAKVAELNVYGGIIKNGVSTSKNHGGGNIAAMTCTKVTVYGGTITGGKAHSGYGGNIYNNGGVLNIYGGSITDGEATSGGNIHSNRKDVTIQGAYIANGKAQNWDAGQTTFHGGNVSLIHGTLHIGLGAWIVDGTAGGHGGNVRCYDAPLTMDGGYIANGTSGFNNGNIWVYCDLKDGDVEKTMDCYFNGGLSVVAAGLTKAGSGLHAQKNVVAHFDGNFTVMDPIGATVNGVLCAGNSTIVEADTWYGSYAK